MERFQRNREELEERFRRGEMEKRREEEPTAPTTEEATPAGEPLAAEVEAEPEPQTVAEVILEQGPANGGPRAEHGPPCEEPAPEPAAAEEVNYQPCLPPWKKPFQRRRNT